MEPREVIPLFWCREWDLMGSAHHSLRFTREHPIVFAFGEGGFKSRKICLYNKTMEPREVIPLFWCREWDLNPHELAFTRT